jgi:hypothetical protein
LIVDAILASSKNLKSAIPLFGVLDAGDQIAQLEHQPKRSWISWKVDWLIAFRRLAFIAVFSKFSVAVSFTRRCIFVLFERFLRNVTLL